MSEARPPLPPFDEDAAIRKVQAAEDAWNTRDPHRVSLAYTPDSVWRNRDAFVTGREQIVEFLTAKWERELDYVLRKSLWGFRDDRIAVRFQYEWHDAAGQWFRSYGNELWEFDDAGLMRRREASPSTTLRSRRRSGATSAPVPTTSAARATTSHSDSSGETTWVCIRPPRTLLEERHERAGAIELGQRPGRSEVGVPERSGSRVQGPT